MMHTLMRLPALVLSALLLCALVLGACASSPPQVVSNRADGEAYAGTGTTMLRLGLMQNRSNPLVDLIRGREERGYIELRYAGLDAAGRAVFVRHDVDPVADPRKAPPRPATGPTGPDEGPTAVPAAPADTREIVLDLRLSRQIRIQGRTIEILEATAAGVVFHLY
jgi:hypothetical protein